MAQALPTRKIGTDDVTALGFGLMVMSAFYGPIESDEERFKLLDAAVEAGCTNWDTAAVYGDNEDLVGKWFKRTGKRNEIFLATKFGITAQGANGKPENVRSSVENNLRRLGIEMIDLYYLHRADRTVPIEVTVGAMAELVKEGKVRYLGLSEVSAATLRRAHAVHPIAAVQVEYSPFFLEIEEETVGLLKACRELGVAVVAYSPLGRGMLTGTYKSNDDIPEGDWRKNIPKFSNENFPNILKLVSVLEEVGKKYDASASQITLAWLLAQGEDIIPIPGTKKIKYVKENLEAIKIKLDAEDVARIRDSANLVNPTLGKGRYTDAGMKSVFADTVELWDYHPGLLKLDAHQFKHLKSLFFIAGGTRFELTANAQIWPRALNVQIGGTASEIYLIVADSASEVGEGLDFVNGFAFLERFYSVFDTGNQRGGFATTPFTKATTN